MKKDNYYDEFEGLSYDQLKSIASYYKSEYVLLSCSFTSLKKENRNLKVRNSCLNERVKNLTKVIDSNIKPSLFCANFEVID